MAPLVFEIGTVLQAVGWPVEPLSRLIVLVLMLAGKVAVVGTAVGVLLSPVLVLVFRCAGAVVRTGGLLIEPFCADECSCWSRVAVSACDSEGLRSSSLRGVLD